MWVVFSLQPWAAAFDPPYRVDSGDQIGYLPVYRTREDAERDFPNAEIRQLVRESQPTEYTAPPGELVKS